MGKVKNWAKLDSYDYEFNGDRELYIPLDSRSDVTSADIATEISQADGHVYVEGLYFDFVDMTIIEKSGFYYLVLELNPKEN